MRGGLLRVSVTEEEAERVRGQVQALRDDGFSGELIERDELPPVLRRRGLCACLVDHDAALHPARWYRALAEAAERAGARICEGTAVQAPVEAPGQGQVQTDGGSVRARHVVVAADGALPVLVAEYKDKVRSRRLHMVATEPPSGREHWSIRAGATSTSSSPGRPAAAGAAFPPRRDGLTTPTAGGQPEVWGRLESYLRDDGPRHKGQSTAGCIVATPTTSSSERPGGPAALAGGYSRNLRIRPAVR